MIVSAQCDLRYATLTELGVQSPATAVNWLSAAELDHWRRFRSPVRKDTFLAGRILAKRLLQERHCAAANCQPAQIAIHSAVNSSTGMRPWIALSGQRLVYALSISHTCDAVFVGGTNRFGISVGVDLVRMRKLGAAFERTWLSEDELALLKRNRHDMTSADIWAMKEAVYKACHHGEAFAPRTVEIRMEPEGTTVRYRGHDLTNCCAVRIWRLGDEIAAVATYRHNGATTTSNGEKRSQPLAIPSS